MLKQVNERHLPYHPYTSVVDDKVYLVTVRSLLPLQPIPPIFLQTKSWSPLSKINGETQTSATGKLIYAALDWRQDAPPTTQDEQEIPVPCIDIIRHDSPWPRITDTQLVDLLTRMITEIDFLHKSLFYAVSLTSVFIVNPSQLGTDYPLHFRLCPFSLGMVQELPTGVFKHQIERLCIAEFILQMATRLEDLSSPLLRKRMMLAFTYSPGLIAAFLDIWRSASGPLVEDVCSSEKTMCDVDPFVGPSPPVIAPDAKVTDFVPAVTAFTLVRSKQRHEYKIDHVPGLLSALRCIDSPTMHSTAVDGIWRFMINATRPLLADAVGIATQCIAIIVPTKKSTALSNPSSISKSVAWILRMNVIDRILFENERSGDYSRLRMAQQRLLEAGIGRQLGGSVTGQNTKFALKVLMPLVRVSTLASFQFPTLSSRLIFDRNVRKMSKMCFEAQPRGDIDATDVLRFVSMMLVMSDFKGWCGSTDTKMDKHADIDVKLLELWERLDDETFLLYALPCWNAKIGDATTAAIVSKLEGAFYRFVTAYMNADVSGKKMIGERLTYALDWLVQFAWNASEQVQNASYQSLYTSYFMAVLFRKHSQSVFFDAPLNREYLPINEVEKADSDERVILPNMIKSFSGSESNSGQTKVDDTPTETPSIWQPSVPTSDDTSTLEGAGGIATLSTSLFNCSLVSSVPSAGVVEKSTASPSIMNTMPSAVHRHSTWHDAVEVPFASWSSNILRAIKRLEGMEPSNPEGLACVLRTFKHPIAARNLVGYAKHHQAVYSDYYVPLPSMHGAPTSENLVFFNLPKSRTDLAYHEDGAPRVRIPPPDGREPIEAGTDCRYSSVWVLPHDEMRAIDPSYTTFEPITLAALNHRICHTKSSPVKGTTGMMDVKIVDGGATNELMVGLSWNIEADANLVGGLEKMVPGRTRNSIGLALHTGHLYFLDKDGKAVRMPYIVPTGTGSRVCIGIAYNKVYFVVDSVFYPLVPDFIIPDGCDIFGLLRVGCSGAKVTTRCMASGWNLDRHLDGTLKYAKTNPVAHSLYLAGLRTKVCPHYHALRRSRNARPTLADIPKSSVLYEALPTEAQELIDRVHVANIHCPPDGCIAPAYLREKISAIIASVETPPSSSKTFDQDVRNYS